MSILPCVFSDLEKLNVDFTSCFRDLGKPNDDFTLCFRYPGNPNVAFTLCFPRAGMGKSYVFEGRRLKMLVLHWFS